VKPQNFLTRKLQQGLCMSNKILFWSLLVSSTALFSCHKQRISKTSNQTVKDSSVVTIARDSAKTELIKPAEVSVAPVKIQEVNFDYLTAKSKFSFKGANQDFDNTNVNIRIKKDSVIWISVTGIGFEVARGLITPDSIVFVDKFHKDYFVFSYAQLSKQYNFDLNFALLQSIIIGNLPFKQSEGNKFVKENEFFVLKQTQGRLNVDNYIGETNLKLTRLKALENPTNNTFDLDYQDFKPVSTYLFPFESLIKLDVKSQQDQQVKQTTMRIKHSKIELPTQSPGFPFTVPSGYTRKR
jgi:hypothetical protein